MKGLGVQIRRKADNENLAEWIVDITTEADRQGSDKFVETYRTQAPQAHCQTFPFLADAVERQGKAVLHIAGEEALCTMMP